MTSSSVEICNLALGKLGSYTVDTIDAPISSHERRLSYLYPHLRRVELRRHRWLFAKKRASLPAIVAIAPEGFQYAFQLPPDCLRALRRSSSDFLVEGKTLFSNYGPTYPLEYTKDEQDVTLFDPLFIEMLACRLAYEMCESVTQSNEKKKDVSAAYQNARVDAAKANGFERGPEANNEDDGSFSWLVAHETGELNLGW